MSVPFPWSLAVNHQSLAFRARLSHAKNEAPEQEADLIALTFVETRCFLSSINRLKGQVSAASCHALGVVVVVNADNKSQCMKITVH